jgi:hypothetical protein
MASALITLTTAGTGTGPFDLYSNTNGYSTPFESSVPKSSLVSGYTSTLVPNGTTIIRVKSNSVGCTNYVDISVSGITTSTTTTSTTVSYVNTGTIYNTPGSAITASTAIIKVNGSAKAYVTLNIPAGGLQQFSTSYTPPVSGNGNNFTLELYASTGVGGSNTMKQSGGDQSTTTGTFSNPGSYWTATSTTTSSSGSQYVISMTIA